MEIKFKKMHEDAQIPTRGTEHSAGLDIYAMEDCVIPASGVRAVGNFSKYVHIGQTAVKTGIMCEIPEGYYGKVEARSGLSFKRGIETGAGVVDADYRHEIGVKLYNFTSVPYEVKKGQRIAQMIIQPYLQCTPVEAGIDTETERGASGFGSTGK